ncbi:MAG: DUF2232 domain-containing protein [Ktedonobacterales bacterium]
MSEDLRILPATSNPAPHNLSLLSDTDAAQQVTLTEASPARPVAPRPSNAVPGASWLDALGLAEGGLLADVGVILDLASIYIPLIGTFLGPAVPTPFVVLVLRRGPRVTLLAAAVSAFLVTIFAGPHFGWRMGLEAVVGLLLGWAMQRRMRPFLIWGIGTLVIATVTFIAALGVIFLTGLPIKDVVDELRNGLGAAAWFLASGAALLGGEGQWLSIRPLLVVVGVLALRLWPILLFAYVTAFALPTVAFYYAIANATARVLGYNVKPFPPLWSIRLMTWAVRTILAILLFPTRALRQLLGRDRQRARVASFPEDGDS